MTAKDAKPGTTWDRLSRLLAARVRVTERVMMRSRTGVCF